MATASKAKTDVAKAAKDDKMETEVEEPVDEAKLTVAGTILDSLAGPAALSKLRSLT
jgi:hypothetical protein